MANGKNIVKSFIIETYGKHVKYVKYEKYCEKKQDILGETWYIVVKQFVQ